MATTDELLNAMESETRDVNSKVLYEIDPLTRLIKVPSDLLLGVESDENSNRLWFVCPKIVGDNVDLTELNLRIIYQNANGKKGKFDIVDVIESVDQPDKIEFSWSLDREATAYKGKTIFKLCAIKPDGTDIDVEWNTYEASGKVLQGLELDEVFPNSISVIRGDSLAATVTVNYKNGDPYVPSEGERLLFIVSDTGASVVLLEKEIPTDTLRLVLNPDDTNSLAVGIYDYKVRLIKSCGDAFTVIPASKLEII